MDEIDALLGTGISTEDELKALADQLRGRKRAADFFAATTVRPIKAAAQREQEAVLESTAQAGVLKKALEERRAREEEARLQREMQVSEGALDRASLERRAAAGGYGGMRRHMGLTRGRNAAGDVVMLGYNPETGQMEEIQAPEGMSITSPMSEIGEAGVLAKTGERLKAVAALEQQFNEVDAAMEPYLKHGIPVEKIPGLGFWEKMPMVGPAVRGLQDLADLESAPQAHMYQAVRSLMNTIARNFAGLTQTAGEVSRINADTGMDIMTDPQAFGKAYERIRRAFVADMELIRATTDPRILEHIAAEPGMLELLDSEEAGRPLEYPESEQSVTDALGLTGDQTLSGAVDAYQQQFQNMTDEEIRRELEALGVPQ